MDKLISGPQCDQSTKSSHFPKDDECKNDVKQQSKAAMKYVQVPILFFTELIERPEPGDLTD